MMSKSEFVIEWTSHVQTLNGLFLFYSPIWPVCLPPSSDQAAKDDLANKRLCFLSLSLSPFLHLFGSQLQFRKRTNVRKQSLAEVLSWELIR